MHRQHQHVGRRARPADLLDLFDAVAVRHRQVERDHVRLGDACQANRFAKRARLGNNFHVLLMVDQQLQPGSQDSVVVGQ